MKSIIISELERFKRWAIAFAGLHLMLLVLINSVTGLLRNSSINLLIFGAMYIGSAAIFGIYQFSSHRKINQWAYLIHRPLSINRIFASFILVAIGLFALVFILPLTLFFVALDLFSQQVVELRHYAFLPLAFLVMVNFYLAACFAVLHPRRIAMVALFAPFVFLYGFEQGYAMFGWLLGSGVWLLLMARLVFKPDLETNLDKPAQIAATVIPIQLSLYVTLAFIGFIGGQMLLYAFNLHPFVNPKPNSYYQVTRNLSEQDAMKWALQGASQQDLDYYAAQTDISEVDVLGYSMREFPIRQQRYQPHINDKNGFFVDSQQQIIWTFNHSQMLYKGSSNRNGDPGWLGRNGVIKDANLATAEDRFDAVPLAESGVLMTQNQVYQWDRQQQRPHLRYQLPQGEEFYSAPEQGSNFVATFSNKALYLFDKRAVARNMQQVTAFARLDLPLAIDQLLTSRVAELADGYLVSLAFGDGRLTGSYLNAENYLFYLSYTGESRLVNRRQFAQSVPAWHRYNDFMIAPLFAMLEQWVEQPGNPAKAIESSGWIIIASVSLLVALIGFKLLLTSAMSPSRKIFWLLSAVLAGIPGLICLWSLSGWQRRLDRQSQQAQLTATLAKA